MKKRIAFLSTMDEYPWGGSEELWSMTAARLLQDGYRGAVWARRWPKPSERIHDLQGLGCELHWRDYNAPSLMRRVLRRLHILPLPQEQGFRWFNSFQPDLIVVSLGFQGDVRSFGSEWERWNCPHVVIIQAVTEVVWPRDPELDGASKFLQAAEACYFVSENNRTLVETQFGCSLPNARIVRNPFNVRYDASPPWPGAEEGVRLACVARDPLRRRRPFRRANRFRRRQRLSRWNSPTTRGGHLCSPLRTPRNRGHRRPRGAVRATGRNAGSPDCSYSSEW